MAKVVLAFLALLLLLGASHAVTSTINLDDSSTFINLTFVTSVCSTGDVYRVIGGVGGFDFMDTSGFAAVIAVDYDVFVTLALDPSTTSINSDTPLPVTPHSASCSGPLESFSMATPSLYVVGGLNQLRFSGINFDVGNALSGPDTDFVILTITGFMAGAGGDPYIYSPFIHRQGLELVEALSHEALASRTALIESATSLLLVDANKVTLTALLGDGSVLVDQGVYMTELSLEVDGESLVVYTQLMDDGTDGTLSLAYNGHRRTCSRDEQAVFSHILGAKVRVTIECGPRQAAYEANKLMMSAWPYQSHETQGRVVVESGSFKAEAFYMQQQYSLEHRKWATMEPFGFFNIHTTPVNGSRYGGVFGTELGSSTRQVMDASGSPEAATAHFLASYLR